MSRHANENHLKNYIKLQILIKETCIVLRNEFCQRWELKYNRKWEDVQDRGNELETGFGREVYKKAGKLQKELLKKGDINKFDVTTLCQLIQVIDVKSLENKKIKDIVEVRNKLAHHPTQEVDRNEYESLWRKLSEALVFFGFPVNKLNQFYDSECVDGITLSNSKVISSQNITQANQLKEQANAAFKNENYLEAITVYSDALELPDLPEEILAILYSNRSAAHQKLSRGDDIDLEEARNDAKSAINCRPSWWKAYYRLGCVYEAKRKYDKAIVAYNKALSLDPNQLQVRSARDACRNEEAILERREHMDPKKMPRSRDEILQKFKQKTGVSDMSSEALKKFMKMARKTGEPSLIAAADVYLAHHYLTGMDDLPQSYDQAAILFAKAAATGNAEAMYNLAILTMHGQGVKRDIPEAIRLLLQVAALPAKIDGSLPNVGVAEAQHQLGLCYTDGVGVDSHPIEAIKWYEKSVENGCSGAANNLGLIYANGIGVPVNIERGVQYWKIAASDGNVLAMESLEAHYMKLLDYKQAKLWWKCALDNGSVTALQRKDTHTKLGAAISSMESGRDWQDVKECFSNMALRHSYYYNKQSPSGSGFSTYPDYSELLENAKKGSVTAKKLIMAFNHFMNGMDLFETKKEHAMVEYIHAFAESYRIENIVPRWEPHVFEELKRITEIHLRSFINQDPSNFELDVRVCYIALRFHSMDEMFEVCEVSIKRFPNEVYFYDIQQCILGFTQRYSEGLTKANKSLQKFPDSVPLLYNKAVHTRLSEKKPELIIDAYEKFIAIAPKDHRKIPECYYVIATHHLQQENMDSCKKFYDRGLKAEKEQLSCFLPYKSSSKDILNNIFRMESLHAKRKDTGISKATSSTSVVNQAVSIKDPKNFKPSLTQLTDPYRVRLTDEHRKFLEASIEAITSGFSIITMNTTKGKHTQRAPAKLTGLKPITFKEMDITKDHVYEGFVLEVTNIEDAFIGPSSIRLLLIDENNDFQRCFVYNYAEVCNANEIQKKLGFGTSYSILNPYMRMAKDMKPGIRIDDPNTIINNSTADSSNKCRFCLSVENLQKCARCKRVWYCSKECQSNDWKLLKHKMICKAI